MGAGQSIRQIAYSQTTLRRTSSCGLAFTAPLTVAPQEGNTTLLQLQAYYAPRGFKVSVMNVLLMRRMMRKRARLTLQGLKRPVEGQC